jgi:hypothetical protein
MDASSSHLIFASETVSAPPDSVFAAGQNPAHRSRHLVIHYPKPADIGVCGRAQYGGNNG